MSMTAAPQCTFSSNGATAGGNGMAAHDGQDTSAGSMPKRVSRPQYDAWIAVLCLWVVTLPRRRAAMVAVGLLVRLVAKPGKEADVISFLEGGLALVEEEPATIAWFAIRLGPSEFGIFDAFPDDAGRQAHLGGQVAAALMAQAPELLAQPPVIEPVDVLAAKLPG
jgi:quinol monooxygenase YgiN